ncbi:MAG: (2Fe-2S)-binding protein [Puniceicoccaceae bacterium]|nr:MAG: (2Fe-2S)-binding protein [Puniceicoccaceae bacterium]
MPKVTFITPDGSPNEVEAGPGSLMEAAVAHNIEGIDADCGGVCSCGTCHVHLDPAWLDRVGPAGPHERDLLDFNDAADASSRLSCQIELNDALDGLVVRVGRRP